VAALCGQLTSVFNSLHGLTKVLNTANTTSYSKVPDIRYSDYIYLTQRRLILILEKSNKIRYGLGRCCSLGGLIYVECSLRDVSPNSRIVYDLVARLVTSLEGLRLPPQYGVSYQVYGHWIFWAIFVGATAAKRGRAQRSSTALGKLVKWLSRVSGKFTNKSWSEVEKSLRSICWSERGRRLVGPSIWEEITRKGYLTTNSCGK
jgi:hypothetical protein